MSDQINATTPEPTVAPVTNAATDFAASILAGLSATPQPAPEVAQPMPVAPMPVAAPQSVPTAPQPAPQSVPTAPQPAPQPVAPPAPQPVDYSQRYSTEATPPPLSVLPELPPEPQIPAQQEGQPPHAAFAAMRSSYGQMRHMAEDFRNKYNKIVEDTKKFQDEKAEFASQLNAKDAEIKRLQDEIGRTDLSKSAEFQERYDAPFRETVGEIEHLLLANGMTQEDATGLAREIVSSNMEEVPDLINRLPTHVQGKIMYQAEAAERLWTERAQALENWRQSAEGLAAVAARGSAIIDAQRMQQLADNAIGIIKGLPPEKGLPPAFQVTDPAFVADRDAKEQQFRAWVQNAPEDQKMAAMFEGFMAPKTYEMVDNVFKENMQLKQMLYARARVDAPPIASMRMPAPNLMQASPPPAPVPPPQAPTIQQNGWSMAEVGNGAQSFAQQLINNMQGQRNLPVI